MPPNTVKVTRPGPWGNPFRIGDAVHRGPAFSGKDELVRDAAHAVRLFRASLWNLKDVARLAVLRGKNLACFCPLDQPCHADVLLDLANAPEATR